MARMHSAGVVHYPMYRVKGSARELGQQHGEAARAKIAGFIGYLCEQLKMKEDKIAEAAARFLPQFETHCPHLVPEIRGLAEGAGVQFEKALACQLRGEISQFNNEACTSFAIGRSGTADGGILAGQTSDMAAEMKDFAYVLHVQPSDRPAAVMWTFGGMIGYHGLNEHGVCHFANALYGGPSWKMAPSHYPLKRLILEQRNLADVRSLFRRFPVCSNGNYMMADQNEILDVELTADGPFELPDVSGAGFLAHSNHYLCSEHACEKNFALGLPDSIPRLQRVRDLITQQMGSLNAESMQRILSDHDNHPVSICRHPHDGYSDDILPASGRTVAAIVAEPQVGRIHVSAGNPCETPFCIYAI